MNSSLLLVLSFLASIATGCLGAFFFYGFKPVSALRKPWAMAAEVGGLEDDHLTFLAILPVSLICAVAVMNDVKISWILVFPILVFHRLFLNIFIGVRADRVSSFLARKKHWKLTLFDGASLAFTALCSSFVAQACLQVK